jgi:RNA recognition motif-containing protein
MRIFVGNLSLLTSDAELALAFQPYGIVKTARVVADGLTSESRGYGFVEMEDQNEALSAIRSLDDSLLNGRAILVNPARGMN